MIDSFCQDFCCIDLIILIDFWSCKFWTDDDAFLTYFHDVAILFLSDSYFFFLLIDLFEKRIDDFYAIFRDTFSDFIWEFRACGELFIMVLEYPD